MWILHRDPSTFPSPEKFDPNRWLGPESQALERYLVPFGKGQRMCVGINLAYCVIYVTLGTIFRRCGMLKLSEMRPEDWIFEDILVTYFPGRKLHVMNNEILE